MKTTDGDTVLLVRRNPDFECRANFRTKNMPGYTWVINTKDELQIVDPQIWAAIDYLSQVPADFPDSDTGLTPSKTIGGKTYEVTNGVMRLPDGSWISG